MSVFDTVKRLKDALVRNKAEQGSWSDYKSILQDILNGVEVDPTQAENICNEIGKSLDDLATDAEVYSKRLAWQAEIEASKAAAPRLQAILSEIDKAVKEYQDATTKHNQRMASLQPQRSELEHTVSRKGIAEQGLRQNVQDPLIIYQREQVRKEILGLVDQERELDYRINGTEATSYRVLIGQARLDYDEREKAYKRAPKDEYTAKKYQEAKGRLDGLEANRSRAVDALKSIREQIAAIRVRQDDIEKRALVP